VLTQVVEVLEETARQYAAEVQGLAAGIPLGKRALGAAIERAVGGLPKTNRCYFNDCRHQDEPRCAIREALAEGTIDRGRYQSFEKLQKELTYLARKQDVRSTIAEKKRWKKLSRLASERAQMKRGGFRSGK